MCAYYEGERHGALECVFELNHGRLADLMVAQNSLYINIRILIIYSGCGDSTQQTEHYEMKYNERTSSMAADEMRWPATLMTSSARDNTVR